MLKISSSPRLDYILLAAATLLIIFSFIVLSSIADFLFPAYFVYLFVAIGTFIIFYKIGFKLVSAFSVHLYIASIIFLLMPLVLGQVTRGAIRWIPLGPLTIQPSEIVRPLLLIFFANYLLNKKLDLKRVFKIVVLITIPLILILIQPSLGVCILTGIGLLGVYLAAGINKRYLGIGILISVLLAPLLWQVLAPYQRSRIVSFINPSKDPYGAGYNTIQSTIAVGSGKLSGRGLGKGVQTQLAFLPERHTDFIFASVAEELGFIGSVFLIGIFAVIYWRLIILVESAKSSQSRAYCTGLFLSLFAQSLIHIGMNVGILPITGIPLPLFSAGGSSLVATSMGVAIAMSAKRA